MLLQNDKSRNVKTAKHKVAEQVFFNCQVKLKNEEHLQKEQNTTRLQINKIRKNHKVMNETQHFNIYIKYYSHLQTVIKFIVP